MRLLVEPALVASGQLTDVLVNRLLNDLRGEPDQLPILQHALMQMWTQDTNDVPDRALTLDDYAAVGGLAGALSKHCDEILYNEFNAEQQRIAEVMFRALCERSWDQHDTRRPAMLGEVAAIAGVDVDAVIPVVDAFRGAGRNFLMPPLPSPLDVETTLDISHESLIRQWPTLNTWVVAEAESARQYQRLEDAAKRRQQRAGAELWRGVDLENIRDWKEREKPTEAWAARYGDAYQLAMDFLTESEAEEENQRRAHEQAQLRELEQARELAEVQRSRAEEQAARYAEQGRTRKPKVIATVSVVLLLLTITFAIYAHSQRSRAAHAEQQAEMAEMARILAEEQRQVAEYRLRETRWLAASTLVGMGRELAKQGAIREAIAAFSAAQAIDPNMEIAADAWNSLCRYGSLRGFAVDVMGACESAVSLEPDNGTIRDSHGLTRALTGDYPGAIDDFRRYLEWGANNGVPEEQIRQRHDWIRALQANQNPFNQELLKRLWNQ
jgi:tetratricopeptide (TPR) repeat protein